MALQKQTQIIEVKFILHDGTEYEAKDEAGASVPTKGTLAYNQFFHKDYVTILGDDVDTYIPYHSIKVMEVKKTMETSEIKDDFCVVPEESE